jgi:hypothetical protein
MGGMRTNSARSAIRFGYKRFCTVAAASVALRSPMFYIILSPLKPFNPLDRGQLQPPTNRHFCATANRRRKGATVRRYVGGLNGSLRGTICTRGMGRSCNAER